MEIAWTGVLAAACVFLAAAAVAADTEFTNTWIAEIRGGEEVAQRVARELGYSYHGKADIFENHYVLKREDHPEVSKRGSHHLTRSLTDVDEVEWAEQQAVVKRTKRGFIPEKKRFNAEEEFKFLDAVFPPQRRPPGVHVVFQGMPRPPPFFISGGGGGFQGGPGGYQGGPGGYQGSGPDSGDFLDEEGNEEYRPFYNPSLDSYNGPLNGGHPVTFPFNNPGSGGGGSGFTLVRPGFAKPPVNQGDLTKLGKFPTTPAPSTNLDTYKGPTENIGCLSVKRSAYADEFNDPLWTKQWYAQDYRTTDVPVMDHNLVPVYRMGITGKSVKVAVVDDGVEHGHPDLEPNFLPRLSYDVGKDSMGSNPDPPPFPGAKGNSHGTKCAGEIAMVANNKLCGVGVAYDSKVAGVKILGHRSTDYVEARGLNYKLNVFDIYSNSWGPEDDGLTMEKIGRLVSNAIERGVTEGRNGKGAVYVFSGGNGRDDGDNCFADGLINNPYTIPISSVSQNGKIVYYSERCTAIMAGAYSSGNKNDERVASIDLNGGCTTSFTGTSAAAPIASGIIALTLDANPKLTNRDIYHIITMGAEVAPVANNPNIWYKNGKGFWVSNDFGFGLLNAENMVKLAKTWKNVPKKNTCTVSIDLEEPEYFTVGEATETEFQTEGCQSTEKDAVRYLEQIVVTSNVQYPYRGAIEIKLTSPAGTKSTIVEPRPKDYNKDGLKDWSIKSYHNWGEDPKGVWKIEVTAVPIENVPKFGGYVKGFTITFHGTALKPAHYDSLPRKYAAFRLPDGKTSEVKKN